MITAEKLKKVIDKKTKLKNIKRRCSWIREIKIELKKSIKNGDTTASIEVLDDFLEEATELLKQKFEPLGFEINTYKPIKHDPRTFIYVGVKETDND